MASIDRPPVYKISVIQLSVLIPASLLALTHTYVTAYSVLLGGLISIIPNAYFSLYAFRYMGARAALQAARSIYWGETGKFLLTVSGFALVFTLVKPLDVLALFLAYTAMIVMQWLIAPRIVTKY